MKLIAKALLGVATFAAILSLSGCAKNIQNKEAVRDGVLAHLKTRGDLDLKLMDVDVANVSFRKGEADATVSFRAKGSTDPGGAMTMSYTLEEKDGKWEVKGKRSAAGADPHGGGMPSAPSGASPGALPPGHPPTGPASGAKN